MYNYMYIIYLQEHVLKRLASFLQSWTSEIIPSESPPEQIVVPIQIFTLARVQCREPHSCWRHGLYSVHAVQPDITDAKGTKLIKSKVQVKSLKYTTIHEFYKLHNLNNVQGW